MEKNYEPMTYSEASWWANKAKKMSHKDAENIQRFLLQRVLEVGVISSEVNDIINGITDRFIEEEREMMRQMMAEELRRRAILDEERIEADDDQIVKAIKWTLPKFKSDWDWGGIYRILVSCCDFPTVKTDFVRRMAQMGIYPDDNQPKDLDRVLPPAIKGTEWHDHKFSYQSIQKGIKSSWPLSFSGWLQSDLADRDFVDRREIAKIFKENIYKAIKQ